MNTKREIRVYKDLMGANEEWAQKIRTVLVGHHTTMLNLIGSPGCGKTTLLEHLEAPLRERAPFAVLEGDRDHERCRTSGCPWGAGLSVTQWGFLPPRSEVGA